MTAEILLQHLGAELVSFGESMQYFHCHRPGPGSRSRMGGKRGRRWNPGSEFGCFGGVSRRAAKARYASIGGHRRLQGDAGRPRTRELSARPAKGGGRRESGSRSGGTGPGGPFPVESRRFEFPTCAADASGRRPWPGPGIFRRNCGVENWRVRGCGEVVKTAHGFRP